MKKLLVCLLAYALMAAQAPAQVTNVVTAGSPAAALDGYGPPAGQWACNSSSAGLIYLQLDAGTVGYAPGYIWVCGATVNGGTLVWLHLTLPQVTDQAGNFINETCIHAKVNSTNTGTWTVSYPSIGTTITSINATSVSPANTIAGSTQATVTTATPTGASGALVSFGTLNVLGINVTIPLLSTTVTPIYVQVCATP